MLFVSQPSFIKDFYNSSSMLLILFIMFLLGVQPSVFKDTFSTKQQIRGALERSEGLLLWKPPAGRTGET